MEINPKKSLGQNFLINAGVLEKIVDAAEITKEDTVLEVGPGTGNLTKLISERAGSVVAIEKDYRLIEDLKLKFPAIKLIEDDILKFKPEEHGLKDNAYKIVANIPYYLTSNLLRIIFEKWPRPKLIVLTIQKEVAQRIIAKSPDMNLLALSIQLYSEPKIIGYISKGSFRPIPKVDSAIIKLTPKEGTNTEDNEKVIEVAKKAFAGKRKQLQNTLSEINLESLGINPKSRPEELSISDWLKMAEDSF
ncbi:MAG: Ribosomal RNA small subunit methyltransferase A [Candidatus Yanofskybacteria bacterium GW2011_GWA1_39_13]|uniref:Ribosomal RNA small subunit methyltransferase A n=1 Tax=Yanofskybacteria sp. (strain GW2011_GWA1_39_13) TaxID=1619019 RepID=A0A0G0PWU2_YANXG|nr:MAG: Ribosomal RNA small subunit methyltransferase A [Candidatus Yanofskybacteria bacterium GW2011_GWA1_39_13]